MAADLSEAKALRIGKLLPIATVLLAGVYPVAIAYGASAVVNSLDTWDVLTTLAASLAVSALLYWASGAVFRDPRKRALWLAIVLLACGTYTIFANTLKLSTMPVNQTSPPVAIGYVIVALTISSIIVRSDNKAPRELTGIATIAFVLVLGNAYRGVSKRWAEPPAWVTTAATLAYAPLTSQNTVTPPSRDIYYIVLDALGRADTLHDLYGLDMDGFVADLKSEGFFVANHARSNYAHTVVSFSSFLNLDYLDSVADSVGRKSESPNAFGYLIQNNALMRLASRAGYEVVGLGTDFAPTRGFQEADLCLCKQYGLSMFEQAVLEQTPFSALPLDPVTYGAHRTRVLATLDALEQGIDTHQRAFVFAHVLVPHPPFIFTSEGKFHRPDRPFMFADGSDYPGTKDEYIRGYHDQAAFVLSRVKEIVHALLSRPGPRPVIVIHADHGPGSRLQLEDLDLTDLDERFDIFAAYYFPDGPSQLYDTITPVNAARILANRYMGTDLPRLADKSYFSTPSHLYDFVKVFQSGASQ